MIGLGLTFGVAVSAGYRGVVDSFHEPLPTLGVFTTDAAGTGSASVTPIMPIASGTAQTSVGLPEELIIPRLGIDAPVMPVGVNATGNLGVPPDATHVAWYKNGPAPGDPGTAVIDGHLDTIHAPQAVFYRLGELVPGDMVDILTGTGRTLFFKVTRVVAYPYNAPAAAIFLSSSNTPGLNLITCSGDWLPAAHVYNERLVVFTELVSSTPVPR